MTASGTQFGDVMVVGGGMSGIQAALDLATSGFKVFLVERNPTIGGKMAQLDKTFPTDDCSMCTLGPRLAARLRCPFVDLDARIEERSGLPVPRFFAEHGEPAFRELESRLLEELLREEACVLAPGGARDAADLVRSFLGREYGYEAWERWLRVQIGGRDCEEETA